MNNIREVAGFVTREPRSSLVLAPLRESALAGETIRITRVRSALRESLIAGDVVEGAVRNDLRDAALLGDTPYPSATARRDTRERLFAASRASTSVTSGEDVRETAIVGDAAHPALPVAGLRERAILVDRATAHTTRREVVREVAQVQGRVSAHAEMMLRSTAIVTERTTTRVRHRLLVRDGAALADAAHVRTGHRAAVRETARVRGAATPTTRHRPNARERAFISGDLEERGTVLGGTVRVDAWTANTVTWAMSYYVDFPFESLAGGFAAAATGVHTPAEASLPWQIVTGKLDFATPKRKRMAYVYGVGEHDDPLTLVVAGDLHGRLAAHEYTQMPREADDVRTVRCAVGRGFCSNYYQLTVSSAAPALLLGMEAAVYVSERRI